MKASELVARQFATQTSAQTQAGVFVRMDGRFAVVNIGASTLTMPCVGVYPPRAGVPVRVDWVNGSPAVTGLVTPQSPFGTISATGSPRATVLVGTETYSLYVLQPYTPVVGDSVAVDWDRYLILGKVSGIDTPDVPGESGGGSKPFALTVRAANSGRYQPGSGWWSNEPWASNSNDGIWVYGNRVKDAVGSGTVTSVDIYLPLIGEAGNASIGVHAYGSIPGGAPSITSTVALPIGQRSGWRRLPSSFGPYLAGGNRGIGVDAPGGGYTRWRGTAADSLSGALRINGTR